VFGDGPGPDAVAMVRMTFHCPTTGLPLRTGIGYESLARDPKLLVTLHCTRCGQLHRFGYADGSIEMSARRPYARRVHG
jgi:hypothetical protein